MNIDWLSLGLGFAVSTFTFTAMWRYKYFNLREQFETLYSLLVLAKREDIEYDIFCPEDEKWYRVELKEIQREDRQ